MNKINIFVVAVLVGAISVACMAQEEEEEQELSLIHISEPTRPY